VLVGREDTLERLQSHVDDGARLITLVGPGGVGKTAVAEAFASGREHVLVRLGAADHLAPALLDALGEPAGELSAVDAVALALARRPATLVVLDELEHLVEQVGALTGLLEESETTFLATSQVPLGLPGERRVRLAPLDSDSALLLLRRLADAQGHPLDAGEDRLRALVSALDGLPLAIELAAARLGTLTPTEILDRLDERRLALLRSERRGGNPRHAALERTLAWTVSLVDERTRRALLECAVFRGRFDLRAAEAILSGDDVLDVLQRLTERSLLVVHAGDGARRFSLLESVRAYALQLAGDTLSETRARHAAHYLARFDPRGDPSFGALRGAWPNLRAIETRGGAEANRATVLLAPLRFAREPLGEHLARLEAAARSDDREVAERAAIRRAEALPPAEAREALSKMTPLSTLRAEWLRASATTHRRAGDLERARETLEAALDAFRAEGRAPAEGAVLRELGVVHLHAGRRAEAERAYREARRVLSRAGRVTAEAVVLTDLAVLLLDAEGDEEATRLLEEARACHRRTGDLRREGIVLSNLGVAAHQTGRVEDARARFEESLRIHRRVGNLRFEGFAMGGLAAVHQERGALVRARDLLEQSVSLFEALGDARWEGWARARLAAVHAARGHADEARSGFAMARGLLERTDPTWWEPALTILRTLLGESMPEVDASSSAARIALRLVESGKPETSPDEPPTHGLVLADDAAWFEAGGERREITRRRVLRRLLTRLARARDEAPGEVVTRDELLDAGWPGEKMLPRAAASRIYVAIRTLRELGLREVLVTRDGGYLLHPGVPFTRSTSTAE